MENCWGVVLVSAVGNAFSRRCCTNATAFALVNAVRYQRPDSATASSAKVTGWPLV